MSDQIERVARAVERAIKELHPLGFDQGHGTFEIYEIASFKPASYEAIARAAIAAASEWLPIETMPIEQSAIVTGETFDGEMYIAIGVRFPNLSGFKQWDLDFGLGLQQLQGKPKSPTAWQPLPQPPKVTT